MGWLKRGAWIAIAWGAWSAAAAGTDLSVHVGYRLNGEIKVSDSSLREDVEPAPLFGLTLDFELKPERFVSLLWTHQRNEVSITGLFPDSDQFAVDVHTLQFGGMYRPEKKRRGALPFVLASGGISYFEADRAGFGSDLSFSMALGGGAEVPVARRVALRFEGRGMIIFSNPSFEGTCGPSDCRITLTSGGDLQFEVLAGLTFFFGD